MVVYEDGSQAGTLGGGLAAAELTIGEGKRGLADERAVDAAT